MARFETVTAVIVMLTEAYPGKFEANAETFRVWSRLLEDIPDRALLAAAVHHTTQCKFVPTIAELRDAAFSITAGDLAPETPGEAWDRVSRAMRQLGSYRAHEAREMLGEVLWRCIGAMGGWRELCLSENGVADRAHFLRAFEQIRDRDRVLVRSLPEVRALTAEYAALPEGKPMQHLPAGMTSAGALALQMAETIREEVV